MQNMRYEEVFIVDYSKLCPPRNASSTRTWCPTCPSPCASCAANFSCRTSTSSPTLRRATAHSARTWRKT